MNIDSLLERRISTFENDRIALQTQREQFQQSLKIILEDFLVANNLHKLVQRKTDKKIGILKTSQSQYYDTTPCRYTFHIRKLDGTFATKPNDIDFFGSDTKQYLKSIFEKYEPYED